MLPGGVAAIIECQTDSKIRTITDIRTLINKAEGHVAPTLHLFQKRGRVVLKNPDGLTEEEVLETAIEAGAEDMEVGEEGIEIWCEPQEMNRVVKTMAESGFRSQSAEISWVAREDTKVEGPEDGEGLERLLEKIEDDPGVTEIYLNTR